MVSWVSLILPASDADYEVKLKDEKWRIVYSFPLFMHVVCYTFILVSLKNPSLKELILNEDKEEEAYKEIRKIYKIGKDENN